MQASTSRALELFEEEDTFSWASVLGSAGEARTSCRSRAARIDSSPSATVTVSGTIDANAPSYRPVNAESRSTTSLGQAGRYGCAGSGAEIRCSPAVPPELTAASNGANGVAPCDNRTPSDSATASSTPLVPASDRDTDERACERAERAPATREPDAGMFARIHPRTAPGGDRRAARSRLRRLTRRAVQQREVIWNAPGSRRLRRARVNLASQVGAERKVPLPDTSSLSHGVGSTWCATVRTGSGAPSAPL